MRYYQDSAISASYFTQGCSDLNTEEAKCMGITRKEASRIGISFTVLGLVILILLIIVSTKVRC